MADEGTNLSPLSALHMAAMAGMPRGLHFELEAGEGSAAGSTVPTPTVVTPPQPAQPPESAAPAFDPSEVERLRRIEQQYKGAKAALIDPLIGAGIKDPDGIKGLLSARERAEKLAEFEKTTGLSFDAFMASVKQPQAQQEPAQADLKAQFAEYAKELGLVSREELAREAAEKEYSSAWESLPKMIDESLDAETVKKILGDNATPAQKVLLKKALMEEVVHHRDPLSDDHPLKDRKFGPPTKASLQRAIDAMVKEMTAAAGADMDAAAKQALSRTPASGTPAGSGSGQGSAKNDDDELPDSPARRIAKQAVARRRAAGAPVG